MWKLLYKWIKRTHPNKSRWWRMERYFDRFNRPRNNRWVFGDKDTGAYLPKFAWTKIVRHVMVTGTASPDDPDLARSWADRRGKQHNRPAGRVAAVGSGVTTTTSSSSARSRTCPTTVSRCPRTTCSVRLGSGIWRSPSTLGRITQVPPRLERRRHRGCRTPKRSAGAGWWPRFAPTLTTTTSTGRRRCRTGSTPQSSKHRYGTAPLARPRVRRRRRTAPAELSCGCCSTPGTPPARPASTPPNWAPSSPAITLSQGGPRRHGGRSYSSFDTIIESIRGTLLTLSADTTIRTGHGDSTTIGTEAAHLKDWLARRHDVMLD
jgi:hypothetical protein